MNNMENNLYLIAIAAPLQDIAEEIHLEKIYCTIQSFRGKEEIFIGEYAPNWDSIKNNFYVIEYNQDKKFYSIKSLGIDYEYYTEKEKNLFQYMDSKGLQFIGAYHPLGDIFHSYPMVILECIRWTADVAWTKEKMKQLVGE